MNNGTPRTPPACARLSTAGAAPGSIIAAIITTHTAMKNPNEPSLVAVPMSIPCICQAATIQLAAASATVAVSAAAVAAGVARATTAGSAGTPVPTAAGTAAFCGSPFIVASLISGVLSGWWGGVSRPREQAGWSLSTPVEVVGQCAERAVPVAGQRGEELLRHPHWRRAQPVAHPAPLPRLGRHQAGLGQQ